MFWSCFRENWVYKFGHSSRRSFTFSVYKINPQVTADVFFITFIMLFNLHWFSIICSKSKDKITKAILAVNCPLWRRVSIWQSCFQQNKKFLNATTTIESLIRITKVMNSSPWYQIKLNTHT